MQKLMQWAGSQGEWTCSEFSGLPRLSHEHNAMQQRWRVVAGGLALILSRLARPELVTRFSASHRLYLLIRQRLRHGQAVHASPELLNDAMHEVAEIADPMTRGSLQACFQASLAEGRIGGPDARPEDGRNSQLRSSSPSQLPSSSGSPTEDTDITSNFTSGILVERASTLRRTIAAARGTSATK